MTDDVTEEALETKLLISFPEYLLVHLRKRAEECGCSLTFVIRKMLIEKYMKEGVNVFREEVDKRSAAYRKGRKPYKPNPYQRNPRLLESEKPKRKKPYRRKNPDMESIGNEPKRKRGRPPGSKNKKNLDIFAEAPAPPPALTTDRISMTGGD